MTQTAIMSFSESVEHAFSDGLAGVVFGGLVVLIGVIMLLRYLIFRKHVKVTEALMNQIQMRDTEQHLYGDDDMGK